MSQEQASRRELIDRIIVAAHLGPEAIKEVSGFSLSLDEAMSLDVKVATTICSHAGPSPLWTSVVPVMSRDPAPIPPRVWLT